MADSLIPTKFELKLALAPAAMAALLRHPAVLAVRSGRMRTARVASVYFDTSDCLLAAEGVALRVQRVGKRWIQTIRGPRGSGSAAGLSVCPEYEWPLAGSALDLAQLSTTRWRKVIARAAKHGGLARCFTTAFERRTVPLRFLDGTLAHLCVDRGEIRAVRDGRTRRVPIAEIEIELESGAAANLYALALALAGDLPVAVMTTSKAERGDALRRGERPILAEPARARNVALAKDASTVDALSALVRECLHQITGNAPGLMEDDEPEWAHQMRIGARRLRSCLGLVARHAPTPELEWVVAEVKWLAGLLGTVRDWDVFTHDTLPPLAAMLGRDEPTGAALKRLRARALARRRIARTAARDAAGSPRYQRLLLAVGLLSARPRFGTKLPANDGPPHALGGRADEFASALFARRQRKLHRCAASLMNGSPEERHAVRIAAKRLRYLAEFFAPLFRHKRAKAYLKPLTGLQDVLGQLNDATTALRIANELGGPTDSAIGALRGWIAAQAAAIEPDLAAVWQRMGDAKPFWIRRN